MPHQNDFYRTRIFFRWLKLATLALPAAAMAADVTFDYPNKPIRIVIGFGAGSTVDISARVIGRGLSGSWKQQVIPDNRPSAGGILAISNNLILKGVISVEALAAKMAEIGERKDPLP